MDYWISSRRTARPHGGGCRFRAANDLSTKQADDRTRELRELKTKKSRATPVPITPGDGNRHSRLSAKPLEEKSARSTVPEPERSALQAGKRRQVWPASGTQAVGHSDSQAGLHVVSTWLGTALASRNAQLLEYRMQANLTTFARLQGRPPPVREQ